MPGSILISRNGFSKTTSTPYFWGIKVKTFKCRHLPHSIFTWPTRCTISPFISTLLHCPHLCFGLWLLGIVALKLHYFPILLKVLVFSFEGANYSYFVPLRIYYKIPDTGSPLESKMMGLLYENYSLRIQLALYPVQKLLDKENGVLLIERLENSIELRYEGFSPEAELIMKFLIAQIKSTQKVRY
jgi:hypothetical protein